MLRYKLLLGSKCKTVSFIESRLGGGQVIVADESYKAGENWCFRRNQLGNMGTQGGKSVEHHPIMPVRADS